MQHYHLLHQHATELQHTWTTVTPPFFSYLFTLAFRIWNASSNSCWAEKNQAYPHIRGRKINLNWGTNKKVRKHKALDGAVLFWGWKLAGIIWNSMEIKCKQKVKLELCFKNLFTLRKRTNISHYKTCTLVLHYVKTSLPYAKFCVEILPSSASLLFFY